MAQRPKDYAKSVKNLTHRFLNNPKITDANKTEFSKWLPNYMVKDSTKDVTIGILEVFLQCSKDIKAEVQNLESLKDVVNAIKQNISRGYWPSIYNRAPAFVNSMYGEDAARRLKTAFGKNWPKTNMRNMRREDYLEWDDALLMCEKTNSIQLRALLMLQMDAGMRPSELLGLKYGSIERKPNGFINVKVKQTKIKGAEFKERDCVCYDSSPYVLRWLDEHPIKEADAPLWLRERQQHKAIIDSVTGKAKRDANGDTITIKIDNSSYDYYAVSKRLKELAKAAGIKKKVDLYGLRHSSCFLDKQRRIPLELAARRHGHGVKFFTDIYAKDRTADDDIVIFEQQKGLLPEQSKPKVNAQCLRCSSINKPDAQYCYKCQSPLTMEMALEYKQSQEDEIQQLKAEILKNYKDIIRREVERIAKKRFH